jgi:hypothetical protein
MTTRTNDEIERWLDDLRRVESGELAPAVIDFPAVMRLLNAMDERLKAAEAELASLRKDPKLEELEKICAQHYRWQGEFHE